MRGRVFRLPKADKDRGDEGMGGAAEYCGVAKCPADNGRDPEDGT